MRTDPIVTQAHRHARAVIDSELNRLARRARCLDPADLDLVRTVLKEIAERILLGPVHDALPHLLPVFALEVDQPRGTP